jgi:hypothetical protein
LCRNITKTWGETPSQPHKAFSKAEKPFSTPRINKRKLEARGYKAGRFLSEPGAVATGYTSKKEESKSEVPPDCLLFPFYLA